MGIGEMIYIPDSLVLSHFTDLKERRLLFVKAFLLVDQPSDAIFLVGLEQCVFLESFWLLVQGQSIVLHGAVCLFGQVFSDFTRGNKLKRRSE
jgi:hypothetical protein